MQFTIPDTNIMVEFTDEMTEGPVLLNLSQIQLVRPAVQEDHAVQVQMKSGEIQWVHGDYPGIVKTILGAIEEEDE